MRLISVVLPTPSDPINITIGFAGAAAQKVPLVVVEPFASSALAMARLAADAWMLKSRMAFPIGFVFE